MIDRETLENEAQTILNQLQAIKILRKISFKNNKIQNYLLITLSLLKDTCELTKDLLGNYKAELNYIKENEFNNLSLEEQKELKENLAFANLYYDKYKLLVEAFEF